MTLYLMSRVPYTLWPPRLPPTAPRPPCATCHAGESSGDEPLVAAEAAALASLSCRSEAALCSSATAAALSNSRRGSCGDPHASYVAVEAALEHASHSAAATSAKLDSRLSRYLLAYLVCNVPALVHTAVLMAVHYGLVTNYPFVVVMVRWTLQVCDLPISPRRAPYLPVSRAYPFVVVMARWTLQPLQGVFNLLVYSNSGSGDGEHGSCADACEACTGCCYWVWCRGPKRWVRPSTMTTQAD